MNPLYMVFDVESVGLHGDGFMFGYVVVDETGKEREANWQACPLQNAAGDDEGRAWVREHVPHIPDGGLMAPRDVRALFWQAWRRWQDKGATLAADCAWPVEARFLAACIDDEPEQRRWQGPYPLVDVASVRLAAGLDPLGTEERLSNELPAHDPLADARQSARLLIEALNACKSAAHV